MKGITPIISIIILLLITIGLASAAWTYMNTYVTGLTSKIMTISATSCLQGTTASFLIKNEGTASIKLGDISALDLNLNRPITFAFSYLNGTASPAMLPAQGVVRAVENTPGYSCTTSGTPKTCLYQITLAGSTQGHDLPIVCSG